MDANKPDFVEAAMYMATQGAQTGQYVATCANDQCGYFGKFDFLPYPPFSSHFSLKFHWRDSMTNQGP
jgi:hypothetical protein